MVRGGLFQEVKVNGYLKAAGCRPWVQMMGEELAGATSCTKGRRQKEPGGLCRESLPDGTHVVGWGGRVTEEEDGPVSLQNY